MSDSLDLLLEAGDITDTRADVVLLKFAQDFHGVERTVALRLGPVGVPMFELTASAGEHRLVETRGGIAAPLALFVGTVPLNSFGYHEIRQFAGRALSALAPREGIRHLACTVHGPGYGLDEDESLLALVGGFIDAFQRGIGPRSLERITVVELHMPRMKRLRKALERGLSGTPGVQALPVGWGFRVQRSSQFIQAPSLASAGTHSLEKPHAFVAMPFAPEFNDVYHYGIQAPVKAAGLLCERVDQDIFDGSIIHRIQERIATAQVVIADLSTANPNVYLEVGYAWGLKRRTVLLVRDHKELRFDVSGHRCLIYRNIQDLETQLARELNHLLG
jgi:hypothetical protein